MNKKDVLLTLAGLYLGFAIYTIYKLIRFFITHLEYV